MRNTSLEKYDAKMAREIIAFLRAYPCEDRKERIAWIKEQISKKKDDFVVYSPEKNGKGKYECIPYSFYGTLGSLSNNEELVSFLRYCFVTEEECNEWIEKVEYDRPYGWGPSDEQMKCLRHVSLGWQPCVDDCKVLESLLNDLDKYRNGEFDKK